MNHDRYISPAFLQSRAKGHFIDGKVVAARSGETIDTYNPSTGDVLATLARGRAEDVDLAVAAASRAFDGPWSRFTPSERPVLLVGG